MSKSSSLSTLVSAAILSVLVGTLAAMTSCDGCGEAEAVIITRKVPTAEGESVAITGPARLVQTIQQEAADLRSLAVMAKECFDTYEASSHYGESAAADKGRREARDACEKILALCQKIRSQHELMEVNGAAPFVENYDSFAHEILEKLGV